MILALVPELEKLKEEGLLEETEFELLNSKIDRNLKKLYSSPKNIKVEPEKEDNWGEDHEESKTSYAPHSPSNKW